MATTFEKRVIQIVPRLLAYSAHWRSKRNGKNQQGKSEEEYHLQPIVYLILWAWTA